jgi:hypothetical protein
MPEITLFAKIAATIAALCLSFAYGFRRGKLNKQNGYELNGASTWDAALWFLSRELSRHKADMDRIEKDIARLIELGAKLPKYPTLNVFFRIPGRDYGSVED